MAFIDLRKAYPSVPRDVLFRVLEKFGIPSHFRQVLKRFYTDLTVKVDFGSNLNTFVRIGRAFQVLSGPAAPATKHGL